MFRTSRGRDGVGGMGNDRALSKGSLVGPFWLRQPGSRVGVFPFALFFFFLFFLFFLFSYFFLVFFFFPLTRGKKRERGRESLGPWASSSSRVLLQGKSSVG
jgi:hypothetical protein